MKKIFSNVVFCLCIAGMVLPYSGCGAKPGKPIKGSGTKEKLSETITNDEGDEVPKGMKSIQD